MYNESPFKPGMPFTDTSSRSSAESECGWFLINGTNKKWNVVEMKKPHLYSLPPLGRKPEREPFGLIYGIFMVFLALVFVIAWAL